MIENFPLDEPRAGQRVVLEAIEKAFTKGYKNVLLEAPVGSGKSAIAITVAQWLRSIDPRPTHILTPRKSLQDQYWEDFHHLDLCLMKGRSAYPCTFDKSEKEYQNVSQCIKSGGRHIFSGTSCAEGPCTTKHKIKPICTKNGQKPCPYQIAIGAAQQKPTIVHNLHSFIFQAYFGENFDVREIMIIDECHEIEGIIRGFATKVVSVPVISRPPHEWTKLSDWVEWFKTFTNNFSTVVSASTGISPREKFEQTLEELLELAGYGFEEGFVVDIQEERGKTSFEFIPDNISGLTERFLLSFGKKRLLMSGTIYDKDTFCKANGLVPGETCFLRIGSTMPIAKRPIYMKKQYMVDTSHKHWNDNFKGMVSSILQVFEAFPDVKGLIHTPSYKASLELELALRDTGRVVVHDAKNFAEVLEKFYASTENQVLLSPVCQQGVDFKYDRARFQIVLRVPYLNTSSKFVERKVKKDFPWYNHQAMVIFGQQAGRVNRADDDEGTTVLLDSRFPGFIAKNHAKFPKWLLDAIIKD